MKEEMQLIAFITQKKRELAELQNAFISLYNDCGKKYGNGKTQAGFLAVAIGLLLKAAPVSKENKVQLLENLKQKV